jgi:hypothetical protein
MNGCAPEVAVSSALLAPLNVAAAHLRERGTRQALLSGMHNPFGRATALTDAWKFLDVCETAEIVDHVAALIGPDVVLWDSELYLDHLSWAQALPREGKYWPADPLAGALVDIDLSRACAGVCDVHHVSALAPPAPGAHYVIRYMPGTSLYNRDPLYPPNRVAMEERPLVNYLTRPLWLVRGEDRAGSDFAAGFQTQAPGWAAESSQMEV